MTPYPGQQVEAREPNGYWRKCRVIRLYYPGSPFLVDPPRSWLVEHVKNGKLALFEERFLRCDHQAELAEAMETLAHASE